MRKTVLLAILSLFSYAREDSFITDYEYAKMLYENPRGIGCDKCHGEDASGKTIASYFDGKKKKKIYIKAPDIRMIDRKRFFKSFKKNHSIMPTYFLTSDEIESLYRYVQKQKNKNESKGSK